jgi:hypothetical protein
MNKALKISLIVAGALVTAAGLLGAGWLVGRTYTNVARFGPARMMSYNRWNDSDSYRQGPRNFGRTGGRWEGCAPFNQMPFSGGGGRGGRPGPGCNDFNPRQRGMGNFPSPSLADQEPLTLTQAREAVEGYVAASNNDDLQVGEVMIFDNHAYATIVEKSTGIGAMEVLVDPATLNVFPEYGPNRMWNLKYGMMAGSGGFGRMGRGMMNGYANVDPDTAMTVSAEQAILNAQTYLERNLPGTEAEDHADPFYGYYTLHVLQDGEVTGMLSVNGFSGDVFLHTWHGNFIEMSMEE